MRRVEYQEGRVLVSLQTKTKPNRPQKCDDERYLTVQVMQLPTYMEIVKTWPEIVLKINLFLTGATETQTATVLRAHKRSRTAGAEDESNM